MDNLRSRKGIITIHDDYLKNIDDCQDILFLIFSQFIPLRIDRDWNGVVYHGYSIQFDEISDT